MKIIFHKVIDDCRKWQGKWSGSTSILLVLQYDYYVYKKGCLLCCFHSYEPPVFENAFIQWSKICSREKRRLERNVQYWGRDPLMVSENILYCDIRGRGGRGEIREWWREGSRGKETNKECTVLGKRPTDGECKYSMGE